MTNRRSWRLYASRRRVPTLVALLAPIGLTATICTAEEPWRIQDAWSPPDWLRISGNHQLRYEWLDNTFRTVDPGTDDLLLSRLLLAAEARVNGALRFAVELQDARAWGSEPATPLSRTMVNALEPLQAYAGITVRDAFSADDTVDLRLGRFTMQMGSNRFVSRHIYRNVLDAHTGASLTWTQKDGKSLQVFAVKPVFRLPLERGRLADNEVELDEDSATFFWGAHLDRISFGTAEAAVFAYGIDDADTARRSTRNRRHLTLGFRLLGDAPDWYWELESAYQFGSIRESSLPDDSRNLDHRAWLLHADFGWRIDTAWNPVVEIRYDYASGDRRLGDDSNERYDSLFGPLRFDYGPTSIYNAIKRENSSALGVYVTLNPSDAGSWMTGYRATWLASDRDRFGESGLRDPLGESGSFAGHQIETRYRQELIPGSLLAEFGGAVLFKGEFLEDAPSAPDTGDTVYVYVQLTTMF